VLAEMLVAEHFEAVCGVSMSANSGPLSSCCPRVALKYPHDVPLNVPDKVRFSALVFG